MTDTPEALLELFESRGWGDGLPLIPPTGDRVEAALRCTDFDPDDVLGVIPPLRSEATVRAVAVNAVMAGCRPEYLPVVLQAVRAMCETPLNLASIQATTNAATIAGFVNGPVIGQLGFNGGANCLGQGNRANATVGRALRLVQTNIGGAAPGVGDRATQGQPGKYGFFFAENESATPWRSYSADLGFPSDVSTVTLFTASGTLNMLESTDDAEELIRSFARTMQSPTSNDYMFNGEPWVVLGPEHAHVVAAAGHDKEAFRRRLWELTPIAQREFSRTVLRYRVRPSWQGILGDLGGDTRIPLGADPSHIRVVVAGGPGTHSTFVPGFGLARAVTMPITDRAGSPLRRFAGGEGSGR